MLKPAVAASIFYPLTPASPSPCPNLHPLNPMSSSQSTSRKMQSARHSRQRKRLAHTHGEEKNRIGETEK